MSDCALCDGVGVVQAAPVETTDVYRGVKPFREQRAAWALAVVVPCFQCGFLNQINQEKP